MPSIYICNAFALSMLDREDQKKASRSPHPIDNPLAVITDRWTHDRIAGLPQTPIVSAIGHADTAALYSKLLQIELPPNRINIKLTNSDILLVGQYIGPRLPEGTTQLPDGAKIEWWQI